MKPDSPRDSSRSPGRAWAGGSRGPTRWVAPRLWLRWWVPALLVPGWLGCAGPGPEDDATVLRLWKATHGETQQDWDKLLAPLHAANPGVRVEVLPHPWDGWDERYAAAFTGGAPPDVAYMPEEFWPRYAAAGRLARLDELFPAQVGRMQKDYPDNLWQLGNMGGHQYAIPYVYVSYQLFYNRALFDHAGVPHPPATPQAEGSDEWTWQRFARVAEELTRDRDGDGTIDQWGFAWGAMGANPNIIYPFLWQGGADLLRPDGRASGLAQHGAVGLRFLQRLCERGVVPEAGLHPTHDDLFFDGRAGMAIVGSAQTVNLRRDFPELDVGAAIVPQGPATDFYEGRGTFGNAGFWVIPAPTRHPEEALALVRFLSDHDQVAAMMDLIHLFGSRLDWEPPPDEPLFATFAAGCRYVVPYPLHPKLRQIHSAIVTQVQAMLLGRQTPEQTAAAAAAAIDGLVATP